jgi:ABC-type transport system substrate-binding protein
VLPVFVPNKNYTGADKAQARYLVFKYFTSETAEVNALETGTYNLTTGGVPTADLTNGTLIASASQPSKCASADTLANGCNGAWAGSNKIGSIGSKYNVEFGSNWGTSYAYFNMTGHATHNALLQQAYIRRALNLTVNQSGLIQTVFHGYAAPDCNVLPQIDDPYENDTSCYGSANYSADKTEAATLLTSHGWTKQSGNYVCTSPGTGSSDCGANIASGSEININFEYLYSAGSDSATELTDLVADWHAFGINVTLDPVSQSQTILGDVFGTDPTYDIALYGGWVYNPGVFISGEQFVLGGSADNATGLNNPIINCSILNTIDLTEPAQCDSVSGFTWHNPSTSAGLMAAAHEYADVTGFTASTAQAPYLYLPNTFWGASEVSKSITWTGPKPDKAFGAKNYLGNPVVNFMPQWIKP